MDCLPYDLSMADNAAMPYSKDKSTSAEKEDSDHITVPMARVGAAGSVTPPGPVITPTDPPVSGDILLGDTDGDKAITIYDATEIQRYLASMSGPSFVAAAADVDGDNSITIFDATAIQRWLAGLPAPAGIGSPV